MKEEEKKIKVDIQKPIKRHRIVCDVSEEDHKEVKRLALTWNMTCTGLIYKALLHYIRCAKREDY